MSRKNVSCIVLVVLICSSLLVVPASAQHLLHVKGKLSTVAAGRNEVFGVDTHANVWRYHASSKSFSKIAGAALVQLAVGGGTLSQRDEIWGLNANGEIYRFNYNTNAFDQVTGNLAQITVGPGNRDSCHPYEVWGVTSGQWVYRYDYCSGQWNLSPGSLLTQIATGGGDVWGINQNGQIFHYSFGTEQFVQVYGTLTQITVGVNDMWGINSSGSAFRFDPGTGQWIWLGSFANQVAAGGDGVWLINAANNVYRFDSSADTFVQVSGSLISVAVGSGAGMFGVNSAGEVFTFVRP